MLNGRHGERLHEWMTAVEADDLPRMPPRGTELRVEHIELDELARQFVADSLGHDGNLTLIANRGRSADYSDNEAVDIEANPVPGGTGVLFLEIAPGRPVRLQ